MCTRSKKNNGDILKSGIYEVLACSSKNNILIRGNLIWNYFNGSGNYEQSASFTNEV